MRTGRDTVSLSVSGLEISTCTIPTPSTQVVEESGCGISLVSYVAKSYSHRQGTL